MKICPKCNRSYTDDSLKFCLEDGTPLLIGSSSSSGSRAAATEVLPQTPTVTTRPNQTVPQQNIHTQPQPSTPQYPSGVSAKPSNAGLFFAIFSLIFTFGGILVFVFALIMALPKDEFYITYVISNIMSSIGIQLNETIIGLFVFFSMFIVPIGTLIGLIALYRAFRSYDGKGAKGFSILAIVVNLLFVIGFVVLMLLGALSNYMEGKF